MKTISTKFRIAAVAGVLALTSGAGIAIGQTAADDAADVAEQVAQEAEDAIEAIDPTTGGESLVVDPSLPQPFEPGLPPIVEDAPRGPAVRFIEREQVQTLPAPQPTVRAPLVQAPKETPKVVSKDPFVIKSILPIEGTIRYGEWYWDESRAPAKGKLIMTVDLDARVISVFRDGHEIGTAVALIGAQSHPTPLGNFPILTKEKDNVSEKYNNAPMPWTLRLTWSGIAIHGSPVANGYASHGCIGVPDPFAEKLFEIAKRGDRVIITRGKMIGIGDKIT